MNYSILRYPFIPLLLFTFQVTAVAQPPIPPLGQRWILNEKYSDEFNGTSLDLTKWYNYHPTWNGREPGIFLPSQVHVENGYMSIRGEKLDEDIVITNWDGSKSTYNIAGGAVVSRAIDAWFGYYECRFKAGKTTMSTTFWLSSRSNSKPGPQPCADRYGLELDIQECIGREGNFNGSWFAKGMHSNSHFWYTDCEGVKHDYRGPNDVRFESDELASDGFNTFGGWWKNESEVSFYFNNGQPKTHQFYSAVKSEPFDIPMGVNLVSETYPFPWISLPTDEELADSSKNICYYDWVRAYNLVGVDSILAGSILTVNGGFETGDFTGWTGWGGAPLLVVSDNVHSGNYAVYVGGPGAPEQNVVLKPNTDYILRCYAKVVDPDFPVILGVKERSSGLTIKSTNIPDTTYTKTELEFTTGSVVNLKFYYYAPGGSSAGYADDFELVEKYPEPQKETVMFDEAVQFTEKPEILTNSSAYNFLISYMANADREIHLDLTNQNDSLISEMLLPAYGGYGYKEVVLELETNLRSFETYTARMQIRPIGSIHSDSAYEWDEFSFVVRDPLNVTVIVQDERLGSLLGGAHVTLNNEQTETDNLGVVVFPEVTVDHQTLGVEMEGYQSVSLADLALNVDTTITVSLTPLNYAMLVYVKDYRTKIPVPGASITIDGVTRQADGTGKAYFVLPYGMNEALISADTYYETLDTVLAGSIQKVDVLVKRQFSNVRFSVKRDHAYFPNATLLFGDQTKITSSTGIANFDNIPVDTVILYSVTKDERVWLVDSSAFYADTTVNIDLSSTAVENFCDETVKVYPNPIQKYLYIKGLTGNVRYRIINLNGITVLQGETSGSAQVNVSSLDESTYLLTLENPDGKVAVRFQVIH